MSYSSGREGYCEECGCHRNDHEFGRCKGGDYNRKSKKHVPCSFEWSQCSTAGHPETMSGEGPVKYVDCFRCYNHPGGKPDNLFESDGLELRTAAEWGILKPVLPTDGPSVRQKGKTSGQSTKKHGSSSKLKGVAKSAKSRDLDDELGLDADPKGKKKETGRSSKKHGSSSKSQKGHQQTTSVDELSWDQDKLDEELSLQMQQVSLQNESDDLPNQDEVTEPGTEREWELVQAWYKGLDYICFRDPTNNKEITTSRLSWVESTVMWQGREEACWLFVSHKLGRTFFSWGID